MQKNSLGINNSTYSTKDIAETAALIVQGQELVRIEKEGNTCWFIFNNSDHCRKISNQFFFGDLLVNAREYYEAMKRLKNRVFAM
jgi:hypothetical protein